MSRCPRVMSPARGCLPGVGTPRVGRAENGGRIRYTPDTDPGKFGARKSPDSRPAPVRDHHRTMVWPLDLCQGCPGRPGLRRRKQRVHHHYPNGSVFCGQSGSRRIVHHTTKRHGTPDESFVCGGRHQKRTTWQQRPADRPRRAILKTIRLSPQRADEQQHLVAERQKLPPAFTPPPRRSTC